MGAFKPLSVKETEELDNLLKMAKAVCSTPMPVIKVNAEKNMIEVSGTAVCMSNFEMGMFGMGHEITSIPGIGMEHEIFGMEHKMTSAPVATGKMDAVILSIIVGLIFSTLSVGIGWVFGSSAEKKEKQKQANYCKEIAEEQQKIYEKYKVLKERLEKTSEEKNDIIRKQQEKIREYEFVFDKLKKKYSELEKNLSFV